MYQTGHSLGTEECWDPQAAESVTDTVQNCRTLSVTEPRDNQSCKRNHGNEFTLFGFEHFELASKFRLGSSKIIKFYHE